MNNFSPTHSKGFTLIEMLVALSLFTIVITIAIGAFLSLIDGSQKIQSEQSVLTTLTFVLDSMTREIRTGTAYYCANSDFTGQESLGSSVQSCDSGARGISFLESGSSITGSSANRIAYYYNDSNQSIMRRVGNGGSESIVSSGIELTEARFFVTGTDRLSFGGDTDQPSVTIILSARDETGATSTLQTTVTQRELDL